MFSDSKETGLEHTDRNFGAWWLGYLFTAPLIILISFPLLIFPKKLRKYDDEGEKTTQIAKLSSPINEIKGYSQLN